DPHGSAIPTAEGEVDQAIYPALADLEAGDRGRIVEVAVHEPEQLRYLGSLDLYPGAEVEVVESAPFDGPVSMNVNGMLRVLSRALARQLYVSGDEPSDEE